MTNAAPEELIPFLAHKDRLVRSYTARLLGLDNEERVEQYLKSVLVQGAAPLRRAAVQAMGDLADDWAIQLLASALRDADPAGPGSGRPGLGPAGRRDRRPGVDRPAVRS